MLPLPAGNLKIKCASILTDQSQSILDIERLYRANNKLCIQGRLMGRFSTNVYLSPGDFYKLLAMIISPSALCFIFLSGYYYIAGKHADKRGSGRKSL